MSPWRLVVALLALRSVHAFRAADMSAKKGLLASQSAKGSVQGEVSSFLFRIPAIGGGNQTVTGVLDIDIDVETGSIKMEAAINSMNSPITAGYMVSGIMKRMYQFTSDDGCEFVELPNLREPSEYVACAEGLLQGGKKWFKDEYVVKADTPETKLGPLTLGGSAALGFHIDSDGGIRNIDFGWWMSIWAFPVLSIGAEWKMTESSLVAPAASVFDPPANWGDCKKSEGDPFKDMDKLSKSQQKWLKCLQQHE